MAGSRLLPKPAHLRGNGLPVRGPRTHCYCGGDVDSSCCFRLPELGLWACVPLGVPRDWWEEPVQDVETGVGSVRPPVVPLVVTFL